MTERYVCGVCGYEYPCSKDEFERLHNDYLCSVCGASKKKFTLHLKEVQIN